MPPFDAEYLAHLPVFGGDARGVDDHAAFAIVHGFQRHHACRCLGGAAETADEVDLDDGVEGIDRKMFNRAGVLVAARGFDRVAGASTVDEDPFLPVGGARLGEADVHAIVLRHVDVAENAADAHRHFFALVGVHVEDGNLDAFGGKCARSGFAEARCAAGNDCGCTLEFHCCSLSILITKCRDVSRIPHT